MSMEIRFTHEVTRAFEKNKMYAGEISADFLLKLIEKCEEEDYDSSFCADADDEKYHIFIKNGWYIKFCVVDGIIRIVRSHEDNYHE